MKNWFDFSNLNEYILHWQVVGDNGKLLAEGNKEVNCAPHATADVTLGKVALPANVREGYLNLSWTRKRSFTDGWHRLGGGLRPICVARNQR